MLVVQCDFLCCYLVLVACPWYVAVSACTYCVSADVLWVMLLGYRLLCIAVVSRVMIVPQTTPAILLVAVLYYGGRIRYVTPDAVLMLS